jgi:hypothetical protein
MKLSAAAIVTLSLPLRRHLGRQAAAREFVVVAPRPLPWDCAAANSVLGSPRDLLDAPCTATVAPASALVLP